jgi:hypothetical protein
MGPGQPDQARGTHGEGRGRGHGRPGTDIGDPERPQPAVPCGSVLGPARPRLALGAGSPAAGLERRAWGARARPPLGHGPQEAGHGLYGPSRHPVWLGAPRWARGYDVMACRGRVPMCGGAGPPLPGDLRREPGDAPRPEAVWPLASRRGACGAAVGHA